MKTLRPNKLLILMISLFTFTFLHAQSPTDNSHGVSTTTDITWTDGGYLTTGDQW
jgi:hypothetical protein